MPSILDFNKPQLNKTEKAIEMLQQQIAIIQNWNQGLQRQIVGILRHLEIEPMDMVKNTRNVEEINKYLLEAQQIEDGIIKTEQAKLDENRDKEVNVLFNKLTSTTSAVIKVSDETKKQVEQFKVNTNL